MDLLGRVRQEVGDQAEAHRMGSRKLGRGKAPALLLAWLPASLTSKKKGPPAIDPADPNSTPVD